MTEPELSQLRSRARELGVQTEFADTSGAQQGARTETLRAMVNLLGGDEPDREPTIPRVIVCWGGKEKFLSLPTGERWPKNAFFPLTPALALEEQNHSGVSADAGRKNGRRVEVRTATRSATLHVPPLPFGYYEFAAELRGCCHRSLIISAPTKAYAPAAFRAWGLFAPLHAIHSKQGWGAGTFIDWQKLCECLPRRGREKTRRAVGDRPCNVLATLPLLGAFLDDWKCEPSPYSPATRLFWNEFFLALTSVPEFSASAAAQRLVSSARFQRQLQKLRAGELVDYRTEMALKRSVLEILAAEFFKCRTSRSREFEAFLKARPALNRYAAFRAACERQQRPWSAWPERMRGGQLRPRDYDPQVARYHTFAQWLAQQQIDAVLTTCRDRNTKLYLDLPLGVNPDGYDVWANQQLFVHEASVGAPPDAFFTKGQDWGFPPLHPQRIREDGYRYVIDYLRFQMRHTGMLRLDHVMGLHRLWWVPRGASAAEGAYVSYPADELYAILCLESHRHQTMLVGENLGTVPPEVNRSMRRHGLRTMFVVQYDAQADPRAALRQPPRDCVASLNTHDMPTWAAFWRGLDIADRQQLRLMTRGQARDESKQRAELRAALEKFLRRKGLLSGRASARSIFGALTKFVTRSDAEVVLLNLEDLWLETRPQNTPGTSSERVNWRRKMKMPLEAAVRHARRAT